jgi:hypothetical protein
VSAVLGWSNGGYFPDAWGALLLVFVLASIGALVLADRLEVGRADLLLVGALSAFAGWQLLSIAWSAGAGRQVLETERTLVYVAWAGALILVVSRARASALVGGLAIGASVVALGGLAEHLFAGGLRGYRLEDPIGYANAAGAMAALALALAASLALGRSTAVRAVAGAAWVPLATALYLSFSRGSFVALGVGLLALLAFASERLRALAVIVVLALPAALAIVLASSFDALTGAAQLADMQHDGRMLGMLLLPIALLGGLASAALARFERSRRLAWRPGRRVVAALVLLAVLAVLVPTVRMGGPVAVVERAVDSFTSTPSGDSDDLNRRLLSASGNVRGDYWRVAWRMTTRSPLVGEGAGSFGRWWLEERPLLHTVRDAHSLYLEVLGELGLFGLALLLVALAAPFALAGRARTSPTGVGALAGYAVWCVHAALDWDWELPVITLTGLGCGVAVLALARRPLTTLSSTRARVAVALGILPLVAAAVVIHLGNGAQVAADSALAADRLDEARREAERAHRWMPWSSEPSRVRGEVALADGEVSEARRSLRHAARLDPDDWTVWYELAIAEEGDAAARALERALELNPLSPELSDFLTDS